MKDLYTHIIESLLDDEDEVFDDAKEDIIKEFLKTNYKINGSYTIKEKGNEFIVDVRGSVKVMNKNITTLTGGLFKFGEVGGYFNCIGCKSLETLEGAPNECKSFDCSWTSISSLKGAPKKCTYFNCNYCDKLTSLEGAPKKVGGAFNCSYCNNLKSLEGAPKCIVIAAHL